MAGPNRNPKNSSAFGRIRAGGQSQTNTHEATAGQHFHFPSPKLDRNSLNFIERDLIASAVIELRRARAFVRSHGLRVLERPASLEISCNAGGAKGVTADFDAHAEIRGTALNHA